MTADEQIIPMDQLDDGSKQRALIRQLNKQLAYWQKRCDLAEELLQFDCPQYDLPYNKQYQAMLKEWEELVNQQPK